MITRLRYDLTELFTLSGGGVGVDAVCVGVVYFPQTALLDATIADEIDRWEAARVSEACEVVLAGTSAAIIAAVQTIELILAKGGRRSRAVSGESAYAEYQAHSGASVYNSQILDGYVAWSGESALRRLPDGVATVVKVVVYWTRRGYWEGPEVELPLSNTSAGGVSGTGGRTIFNYDGPTSGHDNYVRVVPNDVVGVAPAPVRLRLQNLNGAKAFKHFYVGVNALAISSMSHQVEGESFYTPSSAIIGSDANSSGGQVMRVAFTGSVEVAWTLGFGLLQQTAGRSFRILARMPQFGAAVYAKLEIRAAVSSVKLAEGDEVLLSNATYVQDLGVIPLPPGGYNSASDDLYLVLKLRSVSSTTVDLDFFQMYPTEAYRVVTRRGTDALAANDAVVDNLIARPEQIYLEIAASGKRRAVYVGMGRLYVWPGKDQRVYVLADGTGTLIVDSFSLQAWYRPRVATV